MGNAIEGMDGKLARKVVKVLVLCGDSDFGRMLKEVLRSVRKVEATVDVVGSMDTAEIMIGAGYVPDAIFCDCGGPSRSGLVFFEWMMSVHPEWASRFCLVVQDEAMPELDTLRQKGCRCMPRANDAAGIQRVFGEMLAI